MKTLKRNLLSREREETTAMTLCENVYILCLLKLAASLGPAHLLKPFCTTRALEKIEHLFYFVWQLCKCVRVNICDIFSIAD